MKNIIILNYEFTLKKVLQYSIWTISIFFKRTTKLDNIHLNFPIIYKKSYLH